MADVPRALKEILAAKRTHLERRKALIPVETLTESARLRPPARGFLDALEQESERHGVALIAEVKKASPSAGVIRDPFDPIGIAKAYAAAGAAALSILTDRPYFEGRDEYLTAIADTVALPALRKDFMIDPYQIVESRALGADAVLLILSALDDRLAQDLERLALDLGMDVLIETHDAAEMARAGLMRSRLIGINNRNLKTLEVDLDVTHKLAAQAPRDRLLVCESGLKSGRHLAEARRVGAQAGLVGENFMRAEDIEAATRAFLEEARS